nr:immunoglobulin light chain junction region [Macaca mulatta]
DYYCQVCDTTSDHPLF